MSIFSLNHRLCLSRFLNPAKNIHSQFHTLQKFSPKYPVVTKTPWFKTAPSRNFFWIFKKHTKRAIKSIDRPPAQFEIIYRCSIDHALYAFQCLSFFGAITVFGIAVYNMDPSIDDVYLTHGPQSELGYELTPDWKKPMVTNQQEAQLFVVAYFVIYIGMHFLFAKMPMRIYRHPEGQKYLLYHYGVLPTQVNKTPLKAGEIEHIPKDAPSTFGYEIYRHKVTGHKLYMFDHWFRQPNDLFEMLGLQKDTYKLD